MPKNADGIDNILFEFENQQQAYRAGTDMIGKVSLRWKQAIYGFYQNVIILVEIRSRIILNLFC